MNEMTPNTTSTGEIERCPEDVAIGGSFGNEGCFVRTSIAANIDGFWEARSGAWFLGMAQLEFTHEGHTLPLIRCGFEPAAMHATCREGSLEIHQRCFVPSGDLPRVYLWARVRNFGNRELKLNITASGTLQAGPSAMHRRQPELNDMERRFTAEQVTALRMNWQDYGLLQATATDGLRLQLTASTPEAPMLGTGGVWSHATEIQLKPADTRHYWICIEVPRGENAELPPTDAPTAYAELQQFATDLEASVRLGTPSTWLNDGVFRSKLNTVRVMHEFQMGTGFNNDPPGSLLVTRDAAWFSMGANYFAPEFCRRMLDTITIHAPYADGKIAEYLNLNTDPVFKEDYGQNIADPTPLYILAVRHHAAVTGNWDWLRRTYPTLRNATRYLLTQVHGGLVINTSERSEPCLGQCGWRNILDGINISGAVTELQAQSIAAVQACAEVAAWMNDAEMLAECSAILPPMQQALDEHLWDAGRARYRLTGTTMSRPDDASADTDADTVDQIFPLLFGLSSPLQRQSTIERLLSPAYRPAHGVRSAPKGHAAYHSAAQWGLCGGVWPNAGAWVAAAIAPTHPDEALALMEDIVRPLHAARPIDCGALVPGQFPEWLDGEVAISKGMSLSPWMPPTYTWMVLEGLLGFKQGLEGLAVDPHLPPNWDCAFVRNIFYRGELLSVLITSETIYSTHPLSCCDRNVQLADDVTEAWSNDPAVIVMKTRDEALLVACNQSPNAPAITLGQPLGTLPSGTWRSVGAATCA